MSASENACGKLSLPACLIIMDGLGLAPAGPGNAVSLASTPVLDQLFETCSHTKLEASGEAVGLPEGQMGNSEVGHLNIGAGRVVHQELSRINMACRTGSICDNAVINDAIEAAKAPGAALHLMGLLSDGGVHSSNEHLYALIKHAVQSGVGDVRVHAFMDGRDVPPSSGKGYMQQLRDFIAENGFQDAVRVASVSGRYYAMDRDKRWDRVAKAFEAVVCAKPLCRHRTIPMLPMSSSSPWRLMAAVSKMGMPSCSSTSAPIAPVRSRARSSMMPSMDSIALVGPRSRSCA